MGKFSRSPLRGEARRRIGLWILTMGTLPITLPSALLKADDTAAIAFFEKSIRPLIVEKCQSCHGEQKGEGRPPVDGPRIAAERGRERTGCRPGAPDESRLIQAVRYLDEPKMPPKQKLSAGEIAALERWVASGAPWPSSPAGSDDAGGFRADRRASTLVGVPARSERAAPGRRAVRRTVANEIDAFLLDALRSRGITPAPPADRRTWIRRATFDLTGLPPTPDEVAAFLADGSDAAFEKVVDRLLASPAYGQRWARHWLDVARYADYYDADPKTRTASCELTEAWRYRDWVVDAFNRDLPFDQFIVHQIAGDLLPDPDGGEVYPAGLIATTFLSNGVWDRGDADKEKIVSDMVDDQIDTVGKAFLGLTLGCARCHDHKFDPVSQQDYYALAGIFYSTHILKDLGAKGAEYVMNRVPLVPKAQVEAREKQLRLDRGGRGEAGRDREEAAIRRVRTRNGPSSIAERDRLKRGLPPEPPLAMAVQEGGTPGGLFPKIQDVPIHIRGSYARLGPVVARRLPRFFAGDAQPPIREGSGRRELARWVASPANPLTARVIVNRVWQWHFGEGLVRTPSNFGMLSEPPSHPKLLDWLAARFVDGRLVAQETSPAHHAFSRLPAVERRGPRRGLARPGQPLARTVLAAAARRRRGPRRDALRERAARPNARGTGRRRHRHAEALALRPDGPLGPEQLRDALRRGQPRRLHRKTDGLDRRAPGTSVPQPSVRLRAGPAPGRTAGRAEPPATTTPGSSGRTSSCSAGPPARKRSKSAGGFWSAPDRPGAEADWPGLAHLLLCSNEFIYVD